MYLRLSYDLSEATPYPDGLWPPEIRQASDMHAGDISNVYTLKLCNHVGTHIDGPNHFGKHKPPLNSFPIERFLFERPAVIDIPKGDGELIRAGDLQRHHAKILHRDVLLVRTGFTEVRSTDPARYRSASPGFSADAAEYVVEQFPDLRTLALDTISFACPMQLAEGIRAHQILLDLNTRDMFLIEDLNLGFDFTTLSQLIVAPFFCERLDSAPCTVLARVENSG